MLEQAAEMEQDHGPAVAARWLASACSPEACPRRAYELHPEHGRVETLLQVSALRRAFARLVDDELVDWDVEDLKLLQLVEVRIDEYRADGARKEAAAWRRARQ